MSEKLEREFDHFVEFGHLLDRNSRRYLVRYFQDKLTSPTESTQESLLLYLANSTRVNLNLNEAYLAYLKDALDRVLRIDDLLPIMQTNERITEQIVLDTLHWIKKTFTKTVTKHPFVDEVELLEGWAVTPLKDFQRRYPFILKKLKETYLKTELDPDFYDHRFREYVEKDFRDLTPKDRERLELLFTDLLSQWDALLQAKILDYQLRHLAKEEENYTELLEAKVNEYRRLFNILSPVTDYLGWDLSRDLWQDSTLDIIREYDELLLQEESLRELADLLGKMREAEIEIEEETFEKTIVRQEWVVDELAKAEIVGVHESQDLNSLVSSEVGLLSDASTEDLFLKKYADQQLLTFRYEDRRLVSSRENIMEVYQRTRQKEKGPFIVCVDTSESMNGRPELIAKVLCLGIVKMAIRENRRAYLINFSVGIKTVDLLDVANSLEEVAKFLQMSFYGGTDASLALYEALRQLKTNDYEDADVLMISDFVMYKIDRDVLADIAHFQQNKNTEFHSLALSAEANADILQRFDTNWIYNPKEKGIIRELTRGLATLGRD
ncbi:MAG: VWA domain-containing protein [Bacteroidota bacterium]